VEWLNHHIGRSISNWERKKEKEKEKRKKKKEKRKKKKEKVSDHHHEGLLTPTIPTHHPHPHNHNHPPPPLPAHHFHHFPQSKTTTSPRSFRLKFPTKSARAEKNHVSASPECRGGGSTSPA